jgi:hypothetical protein
MRKLSCLPVLFLISTSAFALQSGEYFLQPNVAVGYNAAQGTFYMLGLDAGYLVTDQLTAGVGAFYSFGNHPEHDREIGGGPFAQFDQPLTSFLIASVREDVDYIDQRDPVLVGDTYTHVNENGVVSVTSLGLRLYFTRNFGVMGGYRGVLSLSNTDLGKSRSGTFLTVLFGI